jgi:hypothetical protein
VIFNVLPKGGKKLHQALDGEHAGAIAHKGGNVGLLDAENFTARRCLIRSISFSPP